MISFISFVIHRNNKTRNFDTNLKINFQSHLHIEINNIDTST